MHRTATSPPTTRNDKVKPPVGAWSKSIPDPKPADGAFIRFRSGRVRAALYTPEQFARRPYKGRGLPEYMRVDTPRVPNGIVAGSFAIGIDRKGYAFHNGATYVRVDSNGKAMTFPGRNPPLVRSTLSPSARMF